MITQATEYALRAVAHLADRQGVPCTTAAIAEATVIPADYLAKVMQRLARAGVVQSRRGLHGGFVLAKPAELLPVLEVINAIDPVQRIRRCPLGLPAHESLCPLHRRLDNVAAHVEATFAQVTVRDLLAPAGGAEGCAFPCPATGEAGAAAPEAAREVPA